MTRNDHISLSNGWESSYAQGRRIARYPYDELVAYTFRTFGAQLASGRILRVLELGSGTGNNLAFLAREGFEAYGIEGSETACKVANHFLKEQNLRATIHYGDFSKLPFPDRFFDFIFDRESLYSNYKATILEAVSEAHRCLKLGGRFLSFGYSTEHGSIGNYGGREIEPNTFVDFNGGPFAGTGVVHFFTENEIRNEIFRLFRIEWIRHHRIDFIYPEQTNIYSEFITSGIKE